MINKYKMLVLFTNIWADLKLSGFVANLETIVGTVIVPQWLHLFYSFRGFFVKQTFSSVELFKLFYMQLCKCVA